MEWKSRLKYLTTGRISASENVEKSIEDGTISDKDADFVWNTLNLVALMEIKGILEHEIKRTTEVVMHCMENKDEFQSEIHLLNNFLDVMNEIKERVDNSAAGNV